MSILEGVGHQILAGNHLQGTLAVHTEVLLEELMELAPLEGIAKARFPFEVVEGRSLAEETLFQGSVVEIKNI